jgi:signal peptide peptidase SppA
MLTLIHAVSGRPWAIRSEIAFHIRGLLERDGIAGLRHLAELKREIHATDPRAAAGRGAPGASAQIAVIPVIGTLTQRVQAIESAETRSTAGIAAEVRAAVLDPSVDAVVLDVDSPGGEVFGVPEAWASIRESARIRPVVAVANSVAASAALYLASAASELWVTPSGEVGSVGVYALHVDASKALDRMGEAWDFIVAAKSPYKVEGNPTGPLSDEARAYRQREVDRYMGMFVRDLAKGRNVSEKRVETGFGGGRMLSATEAVAVGMADQVGTFEQAIRRAAELGRGSRGGPRAEALVRPVADASELAARAKLAGVRLED